MSAFDASLVDLHLAADDKVTAVRDLAELVVRSGRGSDVDTIVMDVLARDELGTPQVGGVAIPHARTSAVTVSSVAVGRVGAVTFHDDEEPVDTILMILVPESAVDEHTAILRLLATKLMDTQFTDLLRSTDSSRELVDLLSAGEVGP